MESRHSFESDMVLVEWTKSKTKHDLCCRKMLATAKEEEENSRINNL